MPADRVKTHRIKDAERERAVFTSRALIVFLGLTVLFWVLTGRMVWLMIVQHDKYETLSDENRIQTASIRPPRGLIYDRAGELLADNRTIFSIVVVAEHAGDIESMLAEVGALVTLSEDELAAFRDAMARPHAPLQAMPLKLNLDEEERAIIEVNRHRLPGVDVASDTVRYYPFREVMAHVVGSVRRISKQDQARPPVRDDPRRYLGTQFIGKRGVEAFYEVSLHGEPGWRTVEVDVRGVVQRETARHDPKAGHSLTLHLDTDLQLAASAALGQRRGAVVAIDPNTGGIMAMVSAPGYDPNAFVTGMDAARYAELSQSRDTPLLDRAARGRYAPGSTFKPVVGMAGLALGLTDWRRIVADYGEFRLPGVGRVWRDWSWKPGNAGGQGLVDLRRAIFRSSNVYFYDLGAQMETDALQAFASQFGYGRVTALDVAGADPGILPDSGWKWGQRGEPWYPGDNVNLSIGQGDLLATPLQLATVATVLANRGRLVPPRLLKSSDAPLSEVKPSVVEVVEGVTEDDWQRMVDAMTDVVHRGNAGYRQNGTAWMHIGRDISYRMAGKSGTAQVVGIAQGEKYDEDLLDEYQRKHAWFIAFAPVDAPQLAVAALVENGGGGSSVAGPVVREVLDAYLLPRLVETPKPDLAAVRAGGRPLAARVSSYASSDGA